MGNAAQVIATQIERVESKLPILFERDSTFYSKIASMTGETVSDKDMRVPLELRPGGRSGHFNPDGGDLGRGDTPSYDQAVLNTVYNRHAIEWTHRRQIATDSQRKAVVNTFNRDVASAMDEFRRYLDCLCMTVNGVLATVTSTSNSGGNDTVTCTTDGFGVKLLRFGQDIKIYNAALTTDRTSASERTISLHDLDAKQFVIPQVSGIAATDKVVASGLSGATPTSLFGVPYHHTNASTGTWLGMNRANFPEIRCNRVNANSGALSLPMPRLIMNKIGNRLGARRKTNLTAWAHPAQAQAYEELGFDIISLMQGQPKGKDGLDLYFDQDNLRLAGAPLTKHFAWDATRIDFFDFTMWGRPESMPIQWYKDNNGNKFFVIRGASGGVATSHIAYLVCAFNIYTRNPAADGYIDNLAVPSGY